MQLAAASRFGAALLLVCASAGVAAAAGRISLDPFRPAGGTPAKPSAPATGPFEVADAQPAVATPPPAPAPAPTASAPVAKTCQVDDDCPAENFCSEKGVCQVIQTRTNILYLYYHEGSFLELLGLYWSKRGPSGYSVVAPIYWHYWTPKSRTRVVAPLFWRYDNFATGYRATVIVPGLPISWSSQPDASSFGVWPLFYRSTKFGWAAPLLGSFEIADPDRSSSFGALVYLYWWKRSPKVNRDFAFPLFYSRRSPKDSFTYAVPLTFYWRNKDDKNLLVLPLLYGNQHKNGGALYSLIGYHTREGPETAGALFWLYWFGADAHDKSGYDILFPWLWSFHSPASNTTVAPPLVHLRRKSWYFNTVFPVWWSGGDTSKDEAFRTLLPFVYWQRSAHGKKSLWLTPLGGYSRDDVEGSRTLALLPLILLRRDRTSSLQIITPAFIRYASKESGATTKLIGGALYLRDDPTGSSTALFPLFWRFRDLPSGMSATALLPLFARRSGPAETSTYAGIFPLWAYKRSFADGGWGAGLFPLLFFGRHGESGHGVVFPLFWRFSGPHEATTVALPLFYRHTDRHGASTGIFLPLVFWGHDDSGGHYAIQFPSFWRFGNEREGWSTTVTPIGFHHTDRQGWSAGLPPLLFFGAGGGRSHFALVPLFWRFHDDREQRTTTVVLNYLHRTRGGETTDAFFPLFHYRRGAAPGGADETSFTLFPLVHYRRDATSRVLVTPVGASWKSRERDVGFVGPYAWYRGDTFTASGVPFVYMDVTNRATNERTRQIGPWFALDAPGRRSRVVFPLYGRYDDAQEHDTYVFPTFFRQRKADGYAVDTFLPFFWSSHVGARSTTVIGPWYRHRDARVLNTGLAPIYFYAKNDERSLLVVPPALLYRRADFKTGTVRLTAALVYHARDGDSHTTVVFPLWWSGHEKQRSHRVLFPVYWHFANQEDRSDLTLAGPVFWSARGTWRTRGLLPIAWHTSDATSGATSNAFLPFFYEAHGAQRFRLLTALAGYSATPTSHTWYVGPIASSDSIESRFRMFFPIWFSHENKATESKTRVIPPLLFFSRTTPQTSMTTFLAIFWRHRDIASSVTLGLPLFYDFNDFHESRTTLLLPVFFRHYRAADDTSFVVAPLFYRRSSPSDSTTVAFPLYWDFKNGADRTTVLFPVYAHWRRATYAATYVFPTYYYREGLGPKGPDGTYRRLLIPFFESAVKRRGDYMWEVMGGLFGHETVGRNRYLKVFFMTFESQAPARTQTSWYSKPLRASRREATRGLGANVW